MKALFKKTDSIIYVTIPQKWNKKFTGYPEKKNTQEMTVVCLRILT